MGPTTINALRDVSLDISRNQYVAIMGPSGSGKSTLMNVLGCLDTPSSGDYFLNGTNVSKMHDSELAYIRNKEIGFVFKPLIYCRVLLLWKMSLCLWFMQVFRAQNA